MKTIKNFGELSCYQAPELEVVETLVEQGFAASDWGDGSIDDEENDLGSY